LEPKNKTAKGGGERDNRERPDTYFLKLLNEYSFLPWFFKKILERFEKQQPYFSDLLKEGIKIK
jgi:hypothetical protein